MKRLGMLIMGLALLAGCSTVSYTGKDGVTVRYTRFLAGSDTIKVAIGDKATAEIGGQKVDIELLRAALGVLAGAKP